MKEGRTWVCWSAHLDLLRNMIGGLLLSESGIASVASAQLGPRSICRFSASSCSEAVFQTCWSPKWSDWSHFSSMKANWHMVRKPMQPKLSRHFRTLLLHPPYTCIPFKTTWTPPIAFIRQFGLAAFCARRLTWQSTLLVAIEQLVLADGVCLPFTFWGSESR